MRCDVRWPSRCKLASLQLIASVASTRIMLPYLLFAAAVVAVGMAMAKRNALAAALRIWRDSIAFYLSCGQSMPRASTLFRMQLGDPATVHVLGLGEITFTARHDIANDVFGRHGSQFLQRLGVDWGLQQLGMREQGVIWNNNLDSWRGIRPTFQKGVQDIAVLQASAAASVEAFKHTLEQVQEASGCTAGQSLDLNVLAFFRLVTLRVTLKAGLGLPVEALALAEAEWVVACVTNYFKAWLYFLHQPKVLVIVRNWLPKFIPGGAWGELHKHQQYVRDFNQAVLFLLQCYQTCKEQGTVCRSPHGLFLDKLLSSPAGSQAAQLQQCVLELVLAGTDTSSVTLSWLPLAFKEQPALQQEVYEEAMTLLQKHGAGNTNSSAELWAALQNLAQSYNTRTTPEQQLPLLQACVNESMRYKPVGPVVIRQMGSAPGCHMASVLLGQQDQGPQAQMSMGGTIVVDLEAMHHDNRVFPAAEQFDPHRNFQSNPSVCIAKTSVPNPNFMPFGWGPKSCVGSLLANVEMLMIMACFLAHLKVTGGHETSLEEQEVRWDIANQPTSDIILTLEPRSAGTHARAQSSEAAHNTAKAQGEKPVKTDSHTQQAVSTHRTWPVPGHMTGHSTQQQQDPWKTHLSLSSCTAAPAGPIEEQSNPSTAAESQSQQPDLLACKGSGEDIGAGGFMLVVMGPHGSGKTTLCTQLKQHKVRTNIKVQMVSEVARKLMEEKGWDSGDMNDAIKFMQLQQAIIKRLDRVLSSQDVPNGGKLCLCDRGVVDALAYTAWMFGMKSPQYQELVSMPETARALSSYKPNNCLLLLVPPFQAGPAQADGTRMTHDPDGLLVAFHEVLEERGLAYKELSSKAVVGRVKETLEMLQECNNLPLA